MPLWFDGPTAQAKAIWPDDPHLRHDAAVVRYLDAHSRPGQKVLVLWAAADVYYLADRAPVIPYMWRRNIQAIPGVLDRLRRELAAGRPALVAAVQSPESLDRERPHGCDPRLAVPSRRRRRRRPDLPTATAVVGDGHHGRVKRLAVAVVCAPFRRRGVRERTLAGRLLAVRAAGRIAALGRLHGRDRALLEAAVREARGS